MQSSNAANQDAPDVVQAEFQKELENVQESMIADCRHWTVPDTTTAPPTGSDGSTVPAAAMLYAATGSMAATAVTILVV